MVDGKGGRVDAVRVTSTAGAVFEVEGPGDVGCGSIAATVPAIEVGDVGWGSMAVTVPAMEVGDVGSGLVPVSLLVGGGAATITGCAEPHAPASMPKVSTKNFQTLCLGSCPQPPFLPRGVSGEEVSLERLYLGRRLDTPRTQNPHQTLRQTRHPSQRQPLSCPADVTWETSTQAPPPPGRRSWRVVGRVS